jgi:hypothetical protein
VAGRLAVPEPGHGSSHCRDNTCGGPLDATEENLSGWAVFLTVPQPHYVPDVTSL